MVDAFFDSIPWDELQETQSPISEDCKNFFDSLTNNKTMSPYIATKNTKANEPNTNKPTDSTDAATQMSSIKFVFPRQSSLTAPHQAFYLAARYGTQAAKRSQPLFQRLHRLVLVEQKEFNEWAATITIPSSHHKGLLLQGASLLSARKEYVPDLIFKQPYSLHKELPMKKPARSSVHLRPVQHLFSEGRVAACRQLEGTINCTLPVKFNVSKRSTALSSDSVAQKLASEHSADVLICPSAVYALVNPAGTDVDVPLTVKQIAGSDGKSHRVLVLDRTLSAVNLSEQKKIRWAARKAAKREFFKFDKSYFDFSKMSVQVNKSDFTQQLKDYSAAKTGQLNRNHTYSLWCLEHERTSRNADSAWGRQGCPIRLLVRSQCHGFQERDQAAPLFVHLGVKLEHRPEWGAELLNQSEIMRDWVATLLRPEAMLLRARVDAKTLEVIQVEPKDSRTVASEARQGGINCPATLSGLHTLLSELMQLPEGNFILRVKPQRAEVLVFGPALPGQASVNLDEEYKKDVPDVDNSVLSIAIDPNVVTPFCMQNQRVPATFLPLTSPTKKKSRNKRKKASLENNI
ncbi:uncharacterized protein LOC132197963 isoform X2 [Neocloeon triangulifer]|uniref:uncharacterized protein LOC132197963 isoform X2 n=1 Tax=Neocloeon triangulifer TaxID=2078957 RepID=UPI00286EFC14|nr:uncharacterized protein LOC132197963 isoform X2 [Neocloeon triangulifer]